MMVDATIAPDENQSLRCPSSSVISRAPSPAASSRAAPASTIRRPARRASDPASRFAAKIATVMGAKASPVSRTE